MSNIIDNETKSFDEDMECLYRLADRILSYPDKIALTHVAQGEVEYDVMSDVISRQHNST